MLVILMSYYSKGKGKQIIDKTRVNINKHVNLNNRCNGMASNKMDVKKVYDAS